MTNRLNYFENAPKAMDILLSQENYLNEQFSGESILLELVKMRVSQINQCAFCIDMHSKKALKLGELGERLYGLSIWRDMSCYSKVERQALTWAELITSGQTVTDENYQQALDTFGEGQLVDLTIAINAINSWNRIAKTFKPVIGSLDAN
jgi:AhpD family alkylhydroperoxidase